MVKDSGGVQNANFGILKNGQLFFGYVKYGTGLLQLTNVDKVLCTLICRGAGSSGWTNKWKQQKLK